MHGAISTGRERRERSRPTSSHGAPAATERRLDSGTGVTQGTVAGAVRRRLLAWRRSAQSAG